MDDRKNQFDQLQILIMLFVVEATLLIVHFQTGNKSFLYATALPFIVVIFYILFHENSKIEYSIEKKSFKIVNGSNILELPMNQVRKIEFSDFHNKQTGTHSKMIIITPYKRINNKKNFTLTLFTEVKEQRKIYSQLKMDYTVYRSERAKVLAQKKKVK